MKERTGITLGNMKKIIHEKTTETMGNSNTTYVGNHVGPRVSLTEYNASFCTVGGASEPSGGPTCLCTVCCVSEFFCIVGKGRCCRGEVARSVCSLVCDLRETTGASDTYGFLTSFKWWAIRLPWDETRVVALLVVCLFFRRVLLKVDSALCEGSVCFVALACTFVFIRWTVASGHNHCTRQEKRVSVFRTVCVDRHVTCTS